MEYVRFSTQLVNALSSGSESRSCKWSVQTSLLTQLRIASLNEFESRLQKSQFEDWNALFYMGQIFFTRRESVLHHRCFRLPNQRYSISSVFGNTLSLFLTAIFNLIPYGSTRLMSLFLLPISYPFSITDMKIERYVSFSGKCKVQ